ncbi:MAG: SPFH domain-containing protein [Clostridiales bacterium]|nr:SPFH domain-containing protein [Clostridiales bacterium]
MGLLKNIELPIMYDDCLALKYDTKGNVIKKGSTLTVRETQAAVFCDKGRAADVFGAGMYKLDTDSLPIVTKLLSWKYGFETPFKSEVYFVNTKEFAAVRWGTSNPVPVNTELGIVRLRGNGSYSFKITDPALFLKTIAGFSDYCLINTATDALRALLVGGISTAFAECGVTLRNMTSSYKVLSERVKASAAERCEQIGITVTAFEIENLSVPPELEKALDENARLGIMRDNADVYAKLAQADALKEAAKHGAAGAVFGMGVGMSLGKDMTVGSEKPSTPTKLCSACNKPIDVGAKYCPECGALVKKHCPECGVQITAGTKFCPECGHKLA